MNTITTADYLEDEDVECIWDLEILEARDYHTRLALSDGENSIWLCDYCGQLHDPDDDDGVCECQAEDEDEDEDDGIVAFVGSP